MKEKKITGLYDKSFEKDSCGFGLIANIDNKPSHWLLKTAITSLERLAHRGAVGADGVCYVGFLARRGALSVLGSLPVGDPARSLSIIWYVGGQTPVRVTNLYCRN